MKYIRIIVPLLLCSMLGYYVIGCGAKPTSSGSGSITNSSVSGKIVDPYIEGAIVYVDSNESGTWDPGEMIATSDANGLFTFASSPEIGDIIRILEQGTHVGVTYDAELKRVVDGSGNLNMTPYTTMLANGFTAAQIKDVLQTYAGITINVDDVRDDPMSGLDLSNADSIAKIRGAIAIYALMQIVSDESGQNGYFNYASIESSIPFQNALGQMGSAINSGLSDNILTTVNAAVAVTEGLIPSELPVIPLHTYNVNLPDATAGDIANSAFTVTRYVMDKAIDKGAPSYDPGISGTAIETYGKNVGVRYYILRNLTAEVVTTTPPLISMTMYDALVSGEIDDLSGHTITSWEVNGNTRAFNINQYGTIESVF